MAELSNEFLAGGLGWNGNTSPFTSISDTLGRFWNNLTGKTSSNVFNSAEAQKNRDFQLMMSNTAYSRAVQDMKNAGINPASLGGNATMSPASTPSGSSASSATGSSGGGLIGMVLQGIGMGLKASIMRSALSNKEGYLDLAKFKAKSTASLNAARQVESDVTSALKKQEYDRKASYYADGREERFWKDKKKKKFNDDEWDDPFAGMSDEEKREAIRIANTKWLDS